MQRSVRYLVWAVTATAVVVGAGMAALFLRGTGVDSEALLASLARATSPGGIAIEYPLDGTLFPPEIDAPTLRWKDENARANLWLVTIVFAEGRSHLDHFAAQPQWQPGPRLWAQIKRRSLDRPALVRVVGFDRRTPDQALSAGQVTIQTSSDEVAAPLFYREVNLPFIDDVSYARAAWECFKSDDLDGVERHARKALELNPNSPEALHTLGLAFFARRQYGEAIRHLSQATQAGAGRSRGALQSRRGGIPSGQQGRGDEVLAANGSA